MFNNSFYVTLPSNGSMKLYPGNTLASYTNKLASRITLKEDNWEVGLVEIQYPTVFANIRSKDFWMQFQYGPKSNTKKVTTAIPDGIYDKLENLLLVMNEKLQDSDYVLNFEYLKDINRIKLTFVVSFAEMQTVILSPSLAITLGFILPVDAENMSTFVLYDNDDQMTNDKTVTHDSGETTVAILKTKYPPSIENSIPTHIYIYSDVVAPNFVGDVLAPLLRIVEVDEVGKDTCKTFVEPYYIPVLKRDFETIEINIRKDNGDFVPFLSGKLNVRLHFRRNGALSEKTN